MCASIGCMNSPAYNSTYCDKCMQIASAILKEERNVIKAGDTQALSAKYPKYYKSVGSMTEIDVYAVHQLFNIEDPSGAIQHASKKLLLSGVRTGGKSKRDDIREARDTLNRWLELNP